MRMKKTIGPRGLALFVDGFPFPGHNSLMPSNHLLTSR